MTRRWLILLVLTAVALQGGGLLRALHVSVESGREHGHDDRAVATDDHCLSHTDGGPQVSRQDVDSHDHQHDHATCGTCHGLAQFKADTICSSMGPVAHVLPVFKAEQAEIAWHSSNQLLSLAPRAPPTSSLRVCV